MNINKNIEMLPEGKGIPRYNKKINEIIEAVQWLLGIRVGDNRQLSETPTGPVITIPKTPITATGNWQTDPDGNLAGWGRITLIDTVQGNFFDIWVWRGQKPANVRPVPWMADLNGIAAGWLAGQQGEVWGTGGYPGQATGNFQQVKFTSTQSGIIPQVYTGNAVNPPIVPPSSGPALYLLTDANLNVPAIFIGNPAGHSTTGGTVNFTWQVTYDGTVVYSTSGTIAFPVLGPGQGPGSSGAYFGLPATNWVFDPQNVPGYPYGSKRWVLPCNVAISGNTNPTIIETFNYAVVTSGDAYLSFTTDWGAILPTT